MALRPGIRMVASCEASTLVISARVLVAGVLVRSLAIWDVPMAMIVPAPATIAAGGSSTPVGI